MLDDIDDKEYARSSRASVNQHENSYRKIENIIIPSRLSPSSKDSKRMDSSIEIEQGNRATPTSPSPILQLSPQFWSQILNWAGNVGAGRAEDLNTKKPIEPDRASNNNISSPRLHWNEASLFGDSSLDRSMMPTNGESSQKTQNVTNDEVTSNAEGVLRLLQVIKTLSESTALYKYCVNSSFIILSTFLRGADEENSSLLERNEALQQIQAEHQQSMTEIALFKEVKLIFAFFPRHL